MEDTDERGQDVARRMQEDDEILARVSRAFSGGPKKVVGALEERQAAHEIVLEGPHAVVGGDVLHALVSRLDHETSIAGSLVSRLKQLMVRKLCTSRLHWCVRMWSRAAARSAYVGTVHIRCAKKRRTAVLWRSIGMWMRLWERNKRFALLMAFARSRRVTATLRVCFGAWDESAAQNMRLSAGARQPEMASADLDLLISELHGARASAKKLLRQPETPQSGRARQTNPFATAAEEADKGETDELARALDEARLQVQVK